MFLSDFVLLSNFLLLCLFHSKVYLTCSVIIWLYFTFLNIYLIHSLEHLLSLICIWKSILDASVRKESSDCLVHCLFRRINFLEVEGLPEQKLLRFCIHSSLSKGFLVSCLYCLGALRYFSFLVVAWVGVSFMKFKWKRLLYASECNSMFCTLLIFSDLIF